MKEKDAVPEGSADGARMGKKNSIHWFRKGLRLHDNPALLEALKGSSSYRCVYILDPWFAGSSQVSINKWRYSMCILFLHACFKVLLENLKPYLFRLA